MPWKKANEARLNKLKEKKIKEFILEGEKEILEGGLICWYCGKPIPHNPDGTYVSGHISGEGLVIHSLDGNHDNWHFENKVPVHKKCHQAIHLKDKKLTPEHAKKWSEAGVRGFKKWWNSLSEEEKSARGRKAGIASGKTEAGKEQRRKRREKALEWQKTPEGKHFLTKVLPHLGAKATKDKAKSKKGD